MSDRLLKALMQLFAILANNERYSNSGKSIVKLFLNQQVSPSARQYYLEVFENHLHSFKKEPIAENQLNTGRFIDERLKKIADAINRELKIREKYIVLVRLIEFSVFCCTHLTIEEKNSLRSVAHTFNLSGEDFELCMALVTVQQDEIPDHSSLMLLSATPHPHRQKTQTISCSVSGRGDPAGLHPLCRPHFHEVFRKRC